jgi:hypothetical protein
VVHRLVARHIGLGLALIATGLLGLGSGSARAQASVQVISVRASFEELDRPVTVDLVPPRPQSGAVVSIVDVSDIQLIAVDPLIRPLTYLNEGVTVLEQPRLDEDLRAGGNASFGRSTFVWYDEDGNPIDLILGDYADPSLLVDPDLARTTWDVLQFLVATSCVGEEGPACFDPGQALRVDRCSFNAPLLCANLRGFVAPFLPVPLEVDRLRIKARRRGAKLRASGRLDLEDVPLEKSGSFGVAVGALAARIPLEDFERRGRLRIWRGRADGLRLVILRDDGRFRVLARRVDAALLEGDTLPVMVQVGAGLGATSVPLD